MKVLSVIFVLSFVASALASNYQPGFKHVSNGVAAPYRNDLRQLAVNHVAEYVGSGTGTGRFDGVPGANSGVYYNYPAYGHGGHNAGYGAPNAGYGAPNAGYRAHNAVRGAYGGYGAGYPTGNAYGGAYPSANNYH